MKGVRSDNIIVPQSEGYLQVLTIQDAKWIDFCCYYSPEFTSTLLSDNDVLNSNNVSNEYFRQLMLKFFDPGEAVLESQ